MITANLSKNKIIDRQIGQYLQHNQDNKLTSMNSSDTVILKAFLAALMRLEKPLPSDLQNQINEIGKTFLENITKLAFVVKQYSPLEQEYHSARYTLEDKGERLWFSATDVLDSTQIDEEKLTQFAAEVFNAEDSVGFVKQVYAESTEIGKILFQLRRQTSFMVEITEEIPEEELWVWQNSAVWASLERGLQQAQASKGSYLGDFS